MTQINVLDTLGLISTSFGDWQGVPGGEHVELTDRAAGRHLSLQFERRRDWSAATASAGPSTSA